jgi:hypothetical protein
VSRRLSEQQVVIVSRQLGDVANAAPQEALAEEPCRLFLADFSEPSHSITMFVVTEEDASAIRDVFDRDGELSAAVELRRRFPLIADNAIARQWARTIAGWKPLPVRPKSKPRTNSNRSPKTGAQV